MRTLISIGAAITLASVALAVDYRGTIEKIDVDRRVVMLKSGSGQSMSIPVAKDLKVFDEQGKELPDGLGAKGLKPGTPIAFKRVREKGEEKPEIQAIFIGGRKRRTVGDGSSRASTGLKPLSEMTAADRYLGEDGGLYGGGRNEPSEEHQAAAKRELARIVPLDKDGIPVADGKIVLISISMSNGTQVFSQFKTIADADPEKSKQLTIVDCAQGSMVMAAWATSRPRPQPSPWTVALERLEKAGVTQQQVQVAWIKPANPFPKGEFVEYGKELEEDTRIVVQRAKTFFPNLRIAYLTSRTYAGYASVSPSGDLNPEPYAYESAFVVRWLIQAQTKGDRDLNWDASRGDVKSPLLLWGPYLWADGESPRKGDGFTWTRADISSDGIHPSEAGKRKAAESLLRFFKSDAYASPWFRGVSR
jgi:hypothetical protein